MAEPFRDDDDNPSTTPCRDQNNHFQKVFFMPAEWAPHDACLLLYPQVTEARQQFLQIVQAIATHGEETVIVFCCTKEDASQFQNNIAACTTTSSSRSSMIHALVCPTDDSWARDIGPTFVLSFPSSSFSQQEMKTPFEATTNHNTNTSDDDTMVAEVVGVDWEFNAWGGPDEGCYWPCEQDQLAAQRMCDEINHSASHIFETTTTMSSPLPPVPRPPPPLQTRKVPLLLEGGSVHVDGRGTLITTEECLLNPNRNPTLTRHDIERVLGETLGVTKIIWLPHGLDGDDDTNGHVDNLCCFADKPGHVILSWTDDAVRDKINYERCRIALDILQHPEQRDARGRPLTVHKLPLPPPIYYTEEEVASLDRYNGQPGRQVGERMAASYVNFYIANKAVIVPQFASSSSSADDPQQTTSTHNNNNTANTTTTTTTLEVDKLDRGTALLQAADRRAIEVLAKIFEGTNRTVVGVPSKQILMGGGNIHCITQQLPKAIWPPL